MSLYEVSDIVRDEGFLARDLVRGGDHLRVSEKSGTHSLKQWDRIAARIVPFGDRMEMSGGALPFDHDQSATLLDALRRASKKARLTLDTEVMRTTAFLFTGIWLRDILQWRLHPALPKLCNSDGDEIVWTTATYPLAADGRAIRLALARIPSLRAEGKTFWNWIAAKQEAGKKPPKDAQTIITSLDDGSTVLGTLELKGRTLIFEANSPERSKRGRALIEPVLTDLVGPPAVVSKPVPILGNVSLRRATKTAAGRRKLVDWLKFLENGAAKDISAGYDLRWMWDELGIAELRRRRHRRLGAFPIAAEMVASGKISLSGSSSNGIAPKRAYHLAAFLSFASMASATPPTSVATASARSPAANRRSAPSPLPWQERLTASLARRNTGTSYRPSFFVTLAGTRVNSIEPGLIE